MIITVFDEILSAMGVMIIQKEKFIGTLLISVVFPTKYGLRRQSILGTVHTSMDWYGALARRG